MKIGRIIAAFAFLFLLALAAFSVEPGKRVTVLSYNIHHGEGLDRKVDLERIARIVKSVSPDVVALQEVDNKVPRSGRVDQAAELGRLTEMKAIFGRAIDLDGGTYGNAVLSRLPVESIKNHPFPKVKGREPRAVLELEVALSSGTEDAASFVFLGTHLDYGPDPANRMGAVQAIGKIVSEEQKAPMILAGDLNAVKALATMKMLGEHWVNTSAGKSLRTSPSPKPRFQIDHILYRPAHRWKVIEVRVLDEPVASDHRPIVAVLELLPEKTE